MVVARDTLSPVLGRLLRMHAAPAIMASPPARTLITDPEQLPSRAAWDVVQAARDLHRPTTLDYYAAVFDDGFVELHGDRRSGDDQAVVGGLAQLDGRTVVVIGLQKGHSPPELVRHNFGMPNPAGYHKARRLMAYATRFGFPVLTFVDTPGAFPGAEAERFGQGTAIAECIMRMARLPVPTAVVVTGEGGSGGALALGVGNRVLILENAYFSVISPEGCSSILWGTSEEASRAAEALKITSRELLAMDLVDGVVAEPPGGAPADWETTASNVRSGLLQALDELAGMTPEQLTEDRYARFSRFGAHFEQEAEVPV
jgi:acetyl-CoA carboxylase carboxyl transferase subunit beta